MHTHSTLQRTRITLAVLLLALLPGCDVEEIPLD